VAGKLALEWSPEQISGWLKKHYPTDETMHVSHETIYKSLFIQARGVLKKELVRSRSVSVRQKRRTALFLVTGKATYSAAHIVARSLRWSSGTPASRL
jgi:IS30 family transposase